MRRYLSALSAAAALVVLCGGCYHVTVITGAPASPTTIDKQWQNSFVFGLVSPPEIDAKAQCAQGVAKVETERSFLNGLVSALTWSIYTPMHTEVTCSTR